MSRLYEAVVSWMRGRSRRERIGLAAVPLVLVVAVVGVLLAGGGDGAGRWLAGSSGTAPADAPAGESGGGSNPDAAADDPAPPVDPAATPPPYVNSFAEQPGVKPNPPLPSPTAGVRVDEGIDGCDHAYGERKVCVPWVFPEGVTDKCGWLKDHGFEPLEITGGRDRHKLDRNGDGTACGEGD